MFRLKMPCHLESLRLYILPILLKGNYSCGAKRTKVSFRNPVPLFQSGHYVQEPHFYTRSFGQSNRVVGDGFA